MKIMDPSNIITKILNRVAAVERAVQELRAATGTLGSATIDKGDLRAIGGRISSIDPVTGAAAWLLSSVLRMSPNEADLTIVPARVQVDPGSTYRGLRLIPPVTAGEDAGANAITIIGRGGSDPARTVIEGDAVDLYTGGQFRLYELPTTGSAANLRLDTAGGIPVVYFVTSSRRYKEDIAAATIDPAEVLQLRGRTWVDKGTADRLGDVGEEVNIPRNVGFIAEELDELPSLRQFVDYDDQGRPDAIQYDRVTVALLELAKAQQAHLDALTAQIDALSARLDAIDGGTPEPPADDPQEN